MVTEFDKVDSKRYAVLNSAFSFIGLGLMTIGIACCLFFLLAGIIGVIRGYSVKLFYTNWFMLIIIICSSYDFWPRLRRKYKAVSIFFLIMMSYHLGLTILQGRHLQRGEEFYKQGLYQQAIKEFNKEADTWYLRLKYNNEEEKAMHMLAKSFCQVQDFENAQNTYEIMIERYTGHYAEEAKESTLPRVQ